MFNKRRWKIVYRYICRSLKNPESLARGLGLGLFIGFLPSVGFQVLVALATAGIVGANRLVTALVTLVSNPLTVVPISVFSIWVGDWILPGSGLSELNLGNLELTALWNSSSRLGTSYLVGCLALSTVLGTIGYGTVRIFCRHLFRSRVVSELSGT